jgi:hypothetical protein
VKILLYGLPCKTVYNQLLRELFGFILPSPKDTQLTVPLLLPTVRVGKTTAQCPPPTILCKPTLMSLCGGHWAQNHLPQLKKFLVHHWEFNLAAYVTGDLAINYGITNKNFWLWDIKGNGGQNGKQTVGKERADCQDLQGPLPYCKMWIKVMGLKRPGQLGWQSSCKMMMLHTTFQRDKCVRDKTAEQEKRQKEPCHLKIQLWMPRIKYHKMPWDSAMTFCWHGHTCTEKLILGRLVCSKYIWQVVNFILCSLHST